MPGNVNDCRLYLQKICGTELNIFISSRQTTKYTWWKRKYLINVNQEKIRINKEEK